jgi:hypothetical protein
VVSESANPNARRRQSGAVGKYIVSCMASSGFYWCDHAQLYREAQETTFGCGYEPTAGFDRVVTQAQLTCNSSSQEAVGNPCGFSGLLKIRRFPNLLCRRER